MAPEPADQPTQPREGKRRGAWPLVAASCVWALLLLPIAFFSVIEDLSVGEGYGGLIQRAVVSYLFLAWPLLLVIAVVAAWIAFRRRRLRGAWMFMAAPAVWPIAPLAAGILLLPHFWS